MAPLPPIAPPRLMRLFSSMKTWTAHLSAPSAQLQQETRGLLQMTSRALRLLVILTVLCGVVFPLLVFGIGQVLFPTQVNGSLVTNRHGHVIGSSGHRVIGSSGHRVIGSSGSSSPTQSTSTGVPALSGIMRQAPADPPLGQRIFSCFPAMGVMSPLLQVLRLPLVVRADLPAIALGPIVEHLKMLGN